MKEDKPRARSLRDSFREALHKRDLQSRRRRLTVLPSGFVDFSSNDFLSLATSKAFRARFLQHVVNAPASQPFASGGSRLLDGNCAYAEDLEKFIAEFHNAPCGLLFNSGFDANVGVLSTVPQPGDLIVYDELMHASAREGIRLSRAGRRVRFSHNSPQALEEVLSKEMSAGNGSIRAGHKNVFVVVESLYSMDGDICPLREIVSVMKRLLPRGNGYLIVDEAHATGVYGHHGAGIVQDLGLEKDVFIRVHTFGKALASHGAIVICCPDTREYLVNYARTLIYTTAMGFPSLASIRTAYEFLSEGLTEPLQKRLQELISHLESCLSKPDFPRSPTISIDHVPSTPIFSVRCQYPRELAAVCQAEGFVVRAIMAPTVPEGKERVRICLHAANTTGEIEALVGVLARGLREQKLNRSKL